jgi:hypothetical protein
MRDFKGAEGKTCVDCSHALFLYEVTDEPKSAGTMYPLAHVYRCCHPDELFSERMNRLERSGNPFPCKNWGALGAQKDKGMEGPDLQ